MTNTSVTLAETGIADAINDGGGRWESARNAMFALDFATQAQEMKAFLVSDAAAPVSGAILPGAWRLGRPTWPVNHRDPVTTSHLAGGQPGSGPPPGRKFSAAD